jgi:hypothetical protein
LDETGSQDGQREVIEPMVLIPPTTNEHYRGSPWAWRFLLALAALNLARGSIHLFVSDGGAGQIAGIDLSENREVIVFLFAVMGLQQLAFGVLDLAVALRYRSFVPLLLTLETVKQAVAVAVMWLYKPLPVEAPGKYGAILLLLLLALALFLSLRPRPEATPNARTAEVR